MTRRERLEKFFDTPPWQEPRSCKVSSINAELRALWAVLDAARNVRLNADRHWVDLCDALDAYEEEQDG